jgi:hypothetical protein
MTKRYDQLVRWFIRAALHWTAWLNVPFSAVVGWLFVSLEKVGEN